MPDSIEDIHGRELLCLIHVSERSSFDCFRYCWKQEYAEFVVVLPQLCWSGSGLVSFSRGYCLRKLYRSLATLIILETKSENCTDTVVEAKTTSFAHVVNTIFRSHASPIGMSSLGSSDSCFQSGFSTLIGVPGAASPTHPNLGGEWLSLSLLAWYPTFSVEPASSAYPGHLAACFGSSGSH
eukprot:8075864-Lingulodinium_polyedra.AAC.1